MKAVTGTFKRLLPTTRGAAWTWTDFLSPAVRLPVLRWQPPRVGPRAYSLEEMQMGVMDIRRQLDLARMLREVGGV